MASPEAPPSRPSPSTDAKYSDAASIDEQLQPLHPRSTDANLTTSPATAHALSLPEMLDEIFQYLRRYSAEIEWQNTEYEVEFSEPDLFHTVQVSQTWASRALTLLWERVPPQAISTLSGLPLARQRYYAVMIRSITLDMAPGDFFFTDFDAQLCFPLLQELFICFKGGPAESGFDDGHSKSAGSTRPVCLSTRCPNVWALKITTDQDHVNDLYDVYRIKPSLNALARAVRGWTGLRIVILDTLLLRDEYAFSFFHELANSTTLRHFYALSDPSAQRVGQELVSSTLQTVYSPFPALVSAEVACARREAQSLVNLFADSQDLLALSLWMTDYEGTGWGIFIPDTFPAIHWPVSLASLTDLRIRLTDDNDIRGTTLLSGLQTLSSLRTLAILAARDGSGTVDPDVPSHAYLISDLDDSMFATLCHQHPHLEILLLEIDTDITATSLLTAGLTCRNLHRLTLCGTFDLSLLHSPANTTPFPRLTRLELGHITGLEPSDTEDFVNGADVLDSLAARAENLVKIAPDLTELLVFGDNAHAIVAPGDAGYGMLSIHPDEKEEFRCSKYMGLDLAIYF